MSEDHDSSLREVKSSYEWVNGRRLFEVVAEWIVAAGPSPFVRTMNLTDEIETRQPVKTEDRCGGTDKPLPYLRSDVKQMNEDFKNYKERRRTGRFSGGLERPSGFADHA